MGTDSEREERERELTREREAHLAPGEAAERHREMERKREAIDPTQGEMEEANRERQRNSEAGR